MILYLFACGFHTTSADSSSMQSQTNGARRRWLRRRLKKLLSRGWKSSEVSIVVARCAHQLSFHKTRLLRGSTRPLYSASTEKIYD